MNSEIYTHFHPEERPFVDKASDWVSRALRHEVKLTDFLDPRQAFILASLVNREPDAAIKLDGGSPEAERKRAIVAPTYRPLDDLDFGIKVLSIESSDSGFHNLDHGDYMGAILGLGIKRDKIGDIYVHDRGCHVVAAREMVDYLQMNLRQVHRVHVTSEVTDCDSLIVVKTEFDEFVISVASLRLDGIAGDVYRLSRAKALVPIRAGRCKVNFKVADNPATLLKEGDIVSMQGFGRFKVLEVEGLTKSGRTRVKVGKYI